jgi:hypothetical protein
VRVHDASIPAGSDGLGAKLEVYWAVMNAPWPPLRQPCGIYGARQVSWLTAYRRRRLPRPMKSPVARKASARRLQSRGRPRIGENLPCSLFTLGRNRGTVHWSCPSFGRGCQIEHLNACALRSWGPRRHLPELTSRQAPNIKERAARTSVGKFSSGLGPSVRILAALAGFVDIPNRRAQKSTPDPSATCGFAVEARLPRRGAPTP